MTPNENLSPPRPPLIVRYSKAGLLCSLSAQRSKRMGSSAFMLPASFTTCYFIAECLVNREAKGKRTKTGRYLTAANDYVSFFHTVNVCKALYFQCHLRVSSFALHLDEVHSLERRGNSRCFGSLSVSGLSRSAKMRVIDHRAFIKYIRLTLRSQIGLLETWSRALLNVAWLIDLLGSSGNSKASTNSS